MIIDIPDQIDNILPKKEGFRRIAWMNPYRTGADQCGYFHRWGESYWVKGEKTGICTHAIVEGKDGEVHNVNLYECYVNFIDP